MRLMYRLICEWAQVITTAVWVWLMTSIKETSTSVELPPDHSIVRLGQNATFLCKSNFTKYEVNWLFSPVGRSAELVYNGKVEWPYENKIGGLEVNEDFKLRSELTIMNVQMDDAGLVFCSDEGGAGWPISASLSVVDGIKCSGTCDLRNDELVYICSTCYQTAILEDHSERTKLFHYLSLPNTTQILPSRLNSDSFDSERNCNQMESYWLVKTHCSTFGNYLTVGVKDSSTNATMEAQFTIAVGELIEDSSTSINSNDATSESSAKGIPEMVTKNRIIGIVVGIAIFLIVILVVILVLYCCRTRIFKMMVSKSSRFDFEGKEISLLNVNNLDLEQDHHLHGLMEAKSMCELEIEELRARVNRCKEENDDRLHSGEIMKLEFDRSYWENMKMRKIMIKHRRREIENRRSARQNDYMEEIADLLHRVEIMELEFGHLYWENKVRESERELRLMKCIHKLIELMIKHRRREIENRRRARQNDYMEQFEDTDRNTSLEEIKQTLEELSTSRQKLAERLPRHIELMIKKIEIDLGLLGENFSIENLHTKDRLPQDQREQEIQTGQKDIVVDNNRCADSLLKESDEHSKEAAGVCSSQLLPKFNDNDDSYSKNNKTIERCSFDS